MLSYKHPEILSRGNQILRVRLFHDRAVGKYPTCKNIGHQATNQTDAESVRFSFYSILTLTVTYYILSTLKFLPFNERNNSVHGSQKNQFFSSQKNTLPQG